jgi:hypothetical protein
MNSGLGARGGSGAFSRSNVKRPKGPRLMDGMMAMCREVSRRWEGVRYRGQERRRFVMCK